MSDSIGLLIAASLFFAGSCVCIASVSRYVYERKVIERLDHIERILMQIRDGE